MQLTSHDMQVCALFYMAQKIRYVEMIFTDHIYDEIQLLQKELSHKDGKVWSVSSTINLLLRFCLHEENMIYAQNDSFLSEYMYTKESFLEDFVSRIFMSVH